MSWLGKLLGTKGSRSEAEAELLQARADLEEAKAVREQVESMSERPRKRQIDNHFFRDVVIVRKV